ncbi:MAG: hypothetical protein OEY34_04555 [Cyclobacteriaceae bacterium]|nr:hypothetical protein [Cyclobacteriaceae bacterium]
MKNIYRKYLLPGFVFQSVTIGGGYGTGRELVEFFLKLGPLAGFAAMLVTTILWGVIVAFSFDLARKFKAYNYRAFLRKILGRGWVLYEFLFIATVIITVSVMASASGEIAAEITGFPKIYGIIVMMVIVAFVIFFGTNLIEKILSAWSVALYTAYAILFILCWWKFGDTILGNLSEDKMSTGWMRKGVEYAGYNIAIIPALLFSSRFIETKKEAYISGITVGVMGIVPALLFYTVMIGYYPDIVSTTVPATFILKSVNVPVFELIFQIILFGTFIETGIGFVHGFNERLSDKFEENNKVFSPWMRSIVAVFILIISVVVSDAIGLIDLIAKGYGSITWGYVVVFLIPVLFLGFKNVIIELKNK